MERDDLAEIYNKGTWNFNSHAHVERDLTETEEEHTEEISTHTLTWSVTTSAEMFYYFVDISTHTLTWSVTVKTHCKNSLGKISTHTLTWSVTLDVVYIWCLLNVMRTYFFI